MAANGWREADVAGAATGIWKPTKATRLANRSGPPRREMPVDRKLRDYRIVCEESAAAAQWGLASAQCQACPIPRAEHKALVRRHDWPGYRAEATQSEENP
jgi:hypothetical protein